MLSIQYAVFSFCPFFYYSFYVRGICEKRIVCAIVANGFVYVWQQPQSPNEHTHTRNTHTIYQAMWNLWSVKDNAHYLFKLISPGSRTRAHRANRRFPYSFVHLLVFLFFFLSCHPFFSVISATQWMHLSVIWLSLFLSAFFVVVFFFCYPVWCIIFVCIRGSTEVRYFVFIFHSIFMRDAFPLFTAFVH